MRIVLETAMREVNVNDVSSDCVYGFVGNKGLKIITKVDVDSYTVVSMTTNTFWSPRMWEKDALKYVISKVLRREDVIVYEFDSVDEMLEAYLAGKMGG